MNRLRITFAVCAVVFLIVLAIAPFKDYFSEWKKYQNAYNELVAKLPQRVPPAAIGIKQIWVPALDRVDRCTTCHLGLSEPALANAPQPFRTHPAMHHDIEEFGCTMCHEGQGRATTFKEAIGHVEHWDSPILPREYIEASCGKCHKDQNVRNAPTLTQGRTLIAKYGCNGCHAMNGVAKNWAPPLTGIGAKVNRAWLTKWLKRPKDYFDDSRMPNFNLSDDDVNTLADFLMSFTKLPNGVVLDSSAMTAGKAANQEALVKVGEVKISEARCISCHPINGRGGSFAIELGAVAGKVNRAWLTAYLRNPKKLEPGVEMPQFRFSESDIAGVVAYMEATYSAGSDEAAAAHTPAPDAYEKGLALFKKYDCGGCHALEGVQGGESGPDLTAIGSKKTYEIEFGVSKAEHTLPSYLFTKLKTPRVFGPTMRMPSFELADSDARAISVALLANTSDKIPEALTVPAAPPSKFAPQGKFGTLVDQLACLGCHKMQGRGRMVATDLSIEASQVNVDWMKKYFGVPYSLRPILTQRMPNFYLPDEERAALAEYMGQVFISDSITHPVPGDAESIARGRGLYFERYGCQACHQIESKGGYVGPPLDHAAARLQGSWVFAWLKHPQAYRPESIEPDNKLSDSDAEALAAYVMSLK